MADGNGKTPKARILGLDGRVIRPPNDEGGDFVLVDDLREVVDYFTLQLQRAQSALAIQQQALVQFESQTVSGRIRRLRAWWVIAKARLQLRWEPWRAHLEQLWRELRKP